MKMNFKAIVEQQSLSPSTPLLPLFEAIVNSIQSIEESGISYGRINIKALFPASQPLCRILNIIQAAERSTFPKAVSHIS